MAIPPEEDGMEEARNADNNIIISYSSLHKILPTQLKKTSAHYKVMCGCECCIESKSMHSSFLAWYDCHMKQLKDQGRNALNRRYVEIESHIFETYKGFC